MDLRRESAREEGASGAAEAMASLLESIGRRRGWQRALLLARIQEQWPELAGAAGRDGHPCGLGQGVLWVRVAHPAQASVLQYEQPAILARIERLRREDEPRVSRIRCRVAPDPSSERAGIEPPPNRPVALPPAQEARIQRLTEPIGDPRTREALRRLLRLFSRYPGDDP